MLLLSFDNHKQVGCEYKTSAKISESILWKSISYIEFTIKNILYFIIIWRLSAIHYYVSKNF